MTFVAVFFQTVVYLFITGKTVAGVGLLLWYAGVVGTVDNCLRPILAVQDTEILGLFVLLGTLGGLALFLTVLTIYSQVFEDWLQLDGMNPDSSLAKNSDRPAATPDQGGLINE